MPAIRLATDDDLRRITSKDLAPIFALPWLYVPADEPGVMRPWGVARADGDASVPYHTRQYPDALVAPKHMGERVDRGELLYYGAEPAAEFVEKPASP
jgi:hypothetical protein